jgi:hypothetical protein
MAHAEDTPRADKPGTIAEEKVKAAPEDDEEIAIAEGIRVSVDDDKLAALEAADRVDAPHYS